MEALTKKLATEAKKLKVVSLRELPSPEKYGFKLLKILSLPMSWASDTPVFIYELQIPVLKQTTALK
jgi:hypothetical protein